MRISSFGTQRKAAHWIYVSPAIDVDRFRWSLGPQRIGRIIYGVIASGKAYDEEDAFKLTPANKARRIQRLIQQAQTLGLQIHIAA